MKKAIVFVITGVVVLMAPAMVLAQQASWGSVLKSAGQAAIQQMSPQAQTTLDQAKKLGAGAPQENFLVSKAKEFLAAGNYQPALDLANYVITTIDSKSIDAKKIMEDAKAALMKMAQAKMNAGQQVKADATSSVSGVKNLFGVQK